MAASTKFNTKENKSTHYDPRISKKLNKIAAKLSSKESIQFLNSPTSVLCVQNGGLGNDVSQEELLSLIMPHGQVENIIMLPRKPFSFVCFASESSSKFVYENLNGHILKNGNGPSQDVVLYFLYAEKVPDHAISSWEKPAGLSVIENFIDCETEEKLLLLMNDCTDTQSNQATGSSMKHRRVKHFGYEFKYDTNDVDVADPLPGGLPTLCRTVMEKARDMRLISHCPDQITVNQYQPGQGIPPHIDTEDAFEDGIMSLSLGSQAVMEFRHPDGRHSSVVLPQRSLLVMTGESRYVWSHGITPRKSDIVPALNGKGLTLQSRGIRTSFTFRKVVFDRDAKRIEADANALMLPQNDNEAKELEKEHVHKVYEDIADHFSGTRYKPWPRVVEFLMEQPSHGWLVDVGCGNGKCLGINQSLFEVGCDYSSNLVSIGRSRGFQTCVADITCLPFRPNTFDTVLCIAVIHHMSTQQRRRKALSEVIRILRSGGKALIYVWAMEQNLDKIDSKYIKTSRQKQMETGGFVASPEFVSSVRECVEGVQNFDMKTDSSSVSDSNVKTDTSENSTTTTDSFGYNDSITGRTDNDKSDHDKESAITNRKPLKVHVNRTQFKEQDMLVPWQLKNKQRSESPAADSSTFHRFYHVFKQGELEDLCRTFEECVVCKSYYDQGNWCVVLEKL